MGFDPDPRHLNAGFLLIRYGGTRYDPTARTADRAVRVELGRFLAVIRSPAKRRRGKPRGRHPHKRLSVAFVRSAPPGRHCDGNGLYLYVKPEARSQKPEARSQKPEARSQKPEARSQKPEARSQKPEARSQKPEARSQKPEARSQKPEARSQKPEARSQKPEARSQKPEARSQKPEARSQKPEARSQKPEASLPAGATLRESPAGAGGGLCPL